MQKYEKTFNGANIFKKKIVKSHFFVKTTPFVVKTSKNTFLRHNFRHTKTFFKKNTTIGNRRKRHVLVESYKQKIPSTKILVEGILCCVELYRIV